MADAALDSIRLTAILRGVRPDEVLAVAEVLSSAGIGAIEVTLNSPEPLRSIERLAQACARECLIGAGTVTSVSEVQAVREAGGGFIVSPNTDTAVIRETGRLGMLSMPGCFTPSEAFSALGAGADALKLFPASHIPVQMLKALKSVLPPATPLLAVGGIGAAEMAGYVRHGAHGFGLGSSLYTRGKSLEDVAADARRLVAAFRSAIGENDGDENERN